ncbi:MAG TPA: hypothetical protein VFG34_06540 [Sphingopyxis sp.]|nr:hypothetical protein [Sphingopyxis sp.]
MAGRWSGKSGQGGPWPRGEAERTVSSLNRGPCKWVGARLNIAMGAVGAFTPIDIIVTGDATSFKSSGVFGKYAWSGVRLASPRPV